MHYLMHILSLMLIPIMGLALEGMEELSEDTGNGNDKIDDEEEITVEEEEQEEQEEEIEEESEEDKTEDISQYSPRPTIKEINEKYPNLFKEFPQLRDMYFREDKLTQIFPTVEEAKTAREELDAFQELEVGFRNGRLEDTEFTLKAIKELTDDALPNFVTNFMPSLQKVDEKLYFQAITPVLVDTFKEIYNSGVKSNNENLKNVALAAAMFLFGDKEVATGKTKLNIPSPKTDVTKDKTIENERNAIMTERYNDLMTDVSNEYTTEMTRFILDGMDKDGVMTPFIKNTIAKEVLVRIDKVLLGDASHQSSMSRLWKDAEKERYNRNWKDRIYNAALSRAKSIMPQIRAKAKNEALSMKERSSNSTTDKVNRSNGKSHNTSTAKSNVRPTFIRNADPKKIDWSKTSDLDIMNGKVTLKV